MILLAITIAAIAIGLFMFFTLIGERDWNSFVNWLADHRPFFNIVGKDQEPYLKRVWLFGHRTSRRALMIHQMLTPDQDRFPHDHPWNFLTLVLWGGYVEETPNGKNYVRPWTFHYRPATYIHRITQLPRGRAYTLVLRWPYSRSWGFWEPSSFGNYSSWIYWKKFLGMGENKIIAFKRGERLFLSINGKSEEVSKTQFYCASRDNEHIHKFD